MNASTQTIFSSTEQNISYTQNALYQTQDLKIKHHFYKEMPAALVYLESLVDAELIERNVIAPLRFGKHSFRTVYHVACGDA